jgi:chromosome segregation ATPase
MKDEPNSNARQAEIETMTQEREALRLEVEKLRKQLESLQETHEQEIGQLKTDLEESEAAKEQAETQYQTLLGRVEKIKETLGDRLKRDKAELEEAKDRIEELESQNQQLTHDGEATEAEAAKLRDEVAEQARELASLRSRGNLSQQNWLKEKEELSRQAAHLRSELESTSTAMGEWEVIAMEERATREGLSDKVADVEEQLMQVREAYERAASERDSQSQAVDGLQRALQEIQEARKRELREMVESSESQLQEMKARVASAEKTATEAETARQALANEVERTAPFEKEVKEKNLLIGKLRHEAIVLNDHLTKALRYLMKTKPEESVDRYGGTVFPLLFLASR